MTLCGDAYARLRYLRAAVAVCIELPAALHYEFFSGFPGFIRASSRSEYILRLQDTTDWCNTDYISTPLQAQLLHCLAIMRQDSNKQMKLRNDVQMETTKNYLPCATTIIRQSVRFHGSSTKDSLWYKDWRQNRTEK